VSGEGNLFPYAKKFALACKLLEAGKIAEASELFSRVEEFTDRGPRAFIMHAFGEVATLHFHQSLEAAQLALQRMRDVATQASVADNNG